MVRPTPGHVMNFLSLFAALAAKVVSPTLGHLISQMIRAVLVLDHLVHPRHCHVREGRSRSTQKSMAEKRPRIGGLKIHVSV